MESNAAPDAAATSFHLVLVTVRLRRCGRFRRQSQRVKHPLFKFLRARRALSVLMTDGGRARAKKCAATSMRTGDPPAPAHFVAVVPESEYQFRYRNLYSETPGGSVMKIESRSSLPLAALAALTLLASAARAQESGLAAPLDTREARLSNAFEFAVGVGSAQGFGNLAGGGPSLDDLGVGLAVAARWLLSHHWMRGTSS